MLFEINKYEKCEVSSLVDITLTWNDGIDCDTYSRTFTSERAAFWYVNSTAKSVACARLQHFLVAINKISGLGVEYWHTPAKEKSRKWLWNILPELFEKDLDDICKNILHFKDRLWQIMPGEQHRAYRALKKDVEEILDFARRNQQFSISKNLVKTEAA